MTELSNLDKFKSDIDALLKLGEKLEISLLVQAHGVEEVKKAIKDPDELKRKFENLPSFNVAYEAWYSEALMLVKQVLPDRLADFKEHFEVSKTRKEVNYTTYRIQDALKGTRITRTPFDTIVADTKAAVPHFQQQLAIVMAAKRRFKSSLFEIRQLVQADIFDTELGAAKELLNKKFLRAAGAIAGVVLEKHLGQVCEDHKTKVSKKHPGISDLNETLKAASIIDIPQWRFISMLGDLRNLCDHDKKREPKESEVLDLIDGVGKTLKTLF